MRTLLVLSWAGLLASAAWADKEETRKPNPFAPSLRQLTEKEEEEIDRIIDRFIKFDTGRLGGAEGKKALAEFQKLGPDAIPGLIRGLNKAAQIDASCPALTIGKKLAAMLRASKDPELLEFARENIGAGVTRTKHKAVLGDLRVVCMVRKRVVVSQLALNKGTTNKGTTGARSPRAMSVAELAAAIKKEKGNRLKLLVAELADRRGAEVVSALATAAATKNSELAPLARRHLTRHLAKLGKSALLDRFQDERTEVRAAAARAAGVKKLPLGEELILLLTDDSAEVRKAAHQSLVKLSKGVDYGPKEGASEKERSAALEKWRAWLDRQGKR
jgi:hypothetical protein